MTEDPIVDEVHRTREQILSEYADDLAALVKDAQRRTEDAARAGRPVAPSPAPRPPQQSRSHKKVG